MKVTSAILTSMRGKLGGLVASVARGDIQYFRKLVIPSNPRTLLQNAVRAAMTSASVYWNTLLSEADQEAWWDIAEGSRTGQTIFIRCNQPRVYATNSGRTAGITGTYAAFTLGYVLTPPDSASTPFTAPATVTIDDSANTMAFTANADDPWNAETVSSDQFAVLFIYASHQQNPSRFSRQHSYQLVAAVVREEGSAAVAAVNLNLATHGFTTQVGKVMYVKMVAMAQDGSISIPFERRVTITA
jgi:hypothetical protein